MTDSPQTNNQEAETKRRITELFNIVADGYDNPSTRFFQFAADKMLDILKPKKNTRLLDIATGTGAVATSAAKILKPEGRVYGIDLSEKMLDIAFKNANKMALNNIDLRIMDAEKPIFKNNYFHYITCSFGLFFIPNMPAALINWQKTMQGDAELIISTFANNAFSPLTTCFRARLADYGINIPDEHWFRLSTADECQTLIKKAGFRDVKVHEVQMGYHLLNIEDWWEILWNTGFRGFLNQLSADDLSQFRKEHLKEIEQFNTDKGLWLDINTLFTIAKK